MDYTAIDWHSTSESQYSCMNF